MNLHAMSLTVMKLEIVSRNLIASLMLLFVVPMSLAQDPPPAVDASGYEKIDLPAFFASVRNVSKARLVFLAFSEKDAYGSV